MKTEPDKNKKPDAAAGAVATAQAPQASKPNGAAGSPIANAPPIPVPATEGAALSPEEAKGRADYSHRIMQAFGSIVADEPITKAEEGGLFDDRSAHAPL